MNCIAEGCKRKSANWNTFCNVHFVENNFKNGNLCIERECLDGVFRKDRCRSHYFQYLKKFQLSLNCLYKGCKKRRNYPRRFCMTHVELTNIELGKICKIEGCQRGTYTSGLCCKHR